jgi:hypothetical protein
MLNLNAKLNVWVRDRNCETIKRAAHLHVWDCHDREIISGTNFTEHVEVEVPPGCYIVTAGIYRPNQGNVYTDMTMVIVRCGDDACVNLVLNDFNRRLLPPLPVIGPIKPLPAPITLPTIQQGCAGRIFIPLILNAEMMGIKSEEIQKALGILHKAANFNWDELSVHINAEIDMMETQIKKSPSKDEAELKEINEHLSLLKKYVHIN